MELYPQPLFHLTEHTVRVFWFPSLQLGRAAVAATLTAVGIVLIAKFQSGLPLPRTASDTLYTLSYLIDPSWV